MSAAAEQSPLATAADLLAIPEEKRFHEIIGGELVRKAMPSGPHGRAQQRTLGGRLGDAYDRAPGGKRPGGWWIVTERGDRVHAEPFGDVELSVDAVFGDPED